MAEQIFKNEFAICVFCKDVTVCLADGRLSFAESYTPFQGQVGWLLILGK